MRMRDATPVVIRNGRHVLTRRDDVIAAATDPDRFATLRWAVFSDMASRCRRWCADRVKRSSPRARALIWQGD
jgi:hypothetical protein